MLKKIRNKTQNTEISESNLLKIQILVPEHETPKSNQSPSATWHNSERRPHALSHRPKVGLRKSACEGCQNLSTRNLNREILIQRLWLRARNAVSATRAGRIQADRAQNSLF